MNQFQFELQRCQGLVEVNLAAYFTQNVPQKTLLDAMRYSLLAGGKRIRPILALKFCEAAGGSLEQALPYACAVEMLHTYSLIHDDLPCMDNDDLRRGKPTNHKRFGECTATLAGDALQAAAFETILTAPLPAEVNVAAGLTLARGAGALGMCGGQQLDMEGETRIFTLKEVARMNQLKTGCLLRAACELGCAAAGKTDTESIAAARAYGDKLGLAFQIEDDILDIEGDEKTLGKSIGKDAASEKSTFPSLLGLDACRKLAGELTEQAVAALTPYEGRAFLETLARSLTGRKS